MSADVSSGGRCDMIKVELGGESAADPRFITRLPPAPERDFGFVQSINV